MSDSWSAESVRAAWLRHEIKEIRSQFSPSFWTSAQFDQFSADAKECPELCCERCRGVGSVENAAGDDVECMLCEGTGWAGGQFPFNLVEGKS